MSHTHTHTHTTTHNHTATATRTHMLRHSSPRVSPSQAMLQCGSYLEGHRRQWQASRARAEGCSLEDVPGKVASRRKQAAVLVGGCRYMHTGAGGVLRQATDGDDATSGRGVHACKLRAHHEVQGQATVHQHSVFSSIGCSGIILRAEHIHFLQQPTRCHPLVSTEEQLGCAQQLRTESGRRVPENTRANARNTSSVAATAVSSSSSSLSPSESGIWDRFTASIFATNTTH